MDEWSKWNSEHFSHISLKLNRHSTRITNSLTHYSAVFLFILCLFSYCFYFKHTQKSRLLHVIRILTSCMNKFSIFNFNCCFPFHIIFLSLALFTIMIIVYEILKQKEQVGASMRKHNCNDY